MDRSTAHTIAMVIFLVGAALSWWTLRKLWRRSETPFDRMVYGLGVKVFGAGFQAAMSVWWFARIVQQESSLSRIAVITLGTVVTGLPISLWGGYVWGRLMAFFYGLEPSPQVPSRPL